MTFFFLNKGDTETEKVPVPNIFCLGLNYKKHAEEMKSTLSTEPTVFMKPSSAIIHNNQDIVLPSFSKEVHHELEVLVAIKGTSKNVSVEEAEKFILGIGIGLDLTLRDIQTYAKKKGKPWLLAKGFDTSAPISNFVDISSILDINDLNFDLYINNVLKQSGNTKDMITNISESISYLSSIFTLNRGDIIFTGTPEGVGPIKSGDKLQAKLANLISLNVSVK